MLFKQEIAKKYSNYRLEIDEKDNIFDTLPSWIFIDNFNENISSTELRSN